MPFEQADNSEPRSFAVGELTDRAGLSRSTQDLFQPIDRTSVGQQDLSWALDFGTGADLYRLPAYTGGRLSASALMTDEPEQKLEAPKIQAPSDALTRPSVIRTKEDEAIWDDMQKRHKLGKNESATHIGLSPEVIAEMQAKGQASKLEFFDSADKGAALPTDSIIAIKDDYLNRSQYKEESEADRHIRTMKEHYGAGETVTSFTLRPGVKDAMSASATFAHAVQDLNECKWGNAIRIWRGHPTEITDYSADYNLMELDSKDGARRQAEVFAHEAYHATHQDLDKLYGTGGAVSKKDFVDIKMHQEAGSFLQEIKTNEELHRSRPNPLHTGDDPNKRIEYMWVDKANPKAEPHKQIMNDLLVRDGGGHIVEKASLERIEKFLLAHPAALKDGGGFIKDSNGNYRMNDYVQHYGNAHERYKEEFNNNRSSLIKMGYIRD